MFMKTDVYIFFHSLQLCSTTWMSVSQLVILFWFIFCFAYITGKKSSTGEKPIPPAEPPKPVVPGSWAISLVSLAVAKAGAQMQDTPLYKYIAALKNRKVTLQKHKNMYLHKNYTGSSR